VKRGTDKVIFLPPHPGVLAETARNAWRCGQRLASRWCQPLKRIALAGWLSALVFGFAGGCATPDVDPSAARAGRGYVDLYTMPKTEAWWKVDVFDPGRQSYKEFTAQFKAPGEGVFRIEARPGRHKARISFVNQAIEAPAEVEVEVREGMITPVQVTINQGDSTYVRVVGDRARDVHRNKVTDYQQQRWQISAVAQPFIPYTAKQNTAYWK
jgi:hypothetical protein